MNKIKAVRIFCVTGAIYPRWVSNTGPAPIWELKIVKYDVITIMWRHFHTTVVDAIDWRDWQGEIAPCSIVIEPVGVWLQVRMRGYKKIVSKERISYEDSATDGGGISKCLLREIYNCQ